MAKKSRYNYQKLKSIVWKQQKGQGLYDYNSPNFNKLVSEIYQRGGKKAPSTIIKNLNKEKTNLREFTKTVDSEIFNESHPIQAFAYYDIGREIEKIQNDSAYDGFTLKTDFRNPEIQEIFITNIDEWNYQGSEFQDLVKKVDDYRRNSNIKSPPTDKFTFKVNWNKRELTVVVTDNEGNAPTDKGKKKPKVISTNKSGVINKTKQKQANIATISENKKQAKTKDEILVALIRAGVDKGELTAQGKAINELLDENRTLAKENADIDKYLAQSKGFKKPTKKKGKRK